MLDKITVIITIRNREAWRISGQVKSIRENGASPHFHIIDYGSDESFANEYKNICTEFNLQYTHMYAEGLPWNKCRAINYGARVATTPFIVTSDVDMIYDGNPFQWCLDNYKEKEIYQVESYWLQKNGSKANANSAGHGSPGMFCFLSKDAFAEVGGYDEQIVYWGLEDLDWPLRLEQLGYSQVWLPNDYKIFHQWHKKSESNHNRPITATSDALYRFYQNKLFPVLNQDWGQSLTKENRPILNKIKNTTPHIIQIQENKFGGNNVANAILNGRKHTFVCIALGNRIRRRPFDAFRDITKLLLKPITALTGTKIQDSINNNFDQFYPLLPLLKKNGLSDFYITVDCSSIYLLWE